MNIRIGTMVLTMIALVAPLAAAAESGRASGPASREAAALVTMADLPPAVTAALEAIALAAEARGNGGDAVIVDAQLAEGVRQLAASVRGLNGALDAPVLATVVQLQGAVLGRELAARIVAGSAGAEGSDLWVALDELARAKIAFVRAVVHAGSDGPSNPCNLNLMRCMEFCSNLPTALARSLCALDCEIDYLVCLGTAATRILRPIKDARDLVVL